MGDAMDPSASSRPATFRLAGLEFDLRATVGLIAVTLLLTIGHYRQPFRGDTTVEWLAGGAIENTLLYLVVPLLVIVLAFGDSPRDYGFTLGDWRQGLLWTGIIVALAVPVILAAASTEAMRDYYRNHRGALSALIPIFALDLVGWEFVFRGFLLWCLARRLGPTAIIAQAVPFALAHLGKPELETISTIFGGSLFGWVAWRSRSFAYPFLIHWFIFTLTVWVATRGPA
jgi:membrane protease YdiL (CAAX protease family)